MPKFLRVYPTKDVSLIKSSTNHQIAGMQLTKFNQPDRKLAPNLLKDVAEQARGTVEDLESVSNR